MAVDDGGDEEAMTRASDGASNADAHPRYVEGLLRSEAYPHAPGEVRLVQTHISYVFLAGDVVYKTKKPVDFGFIDQRSREVRERNCHSEVELNRRLAPDVYLGVVPIVELPGGGFRVEPGEGARGEYVEPAVKMRRLDDNRMLEHLLAQDEAPADIAQRLTATLVPFHRSAATVTNDPDFAGAKAMQAWWEEESSELAPYAGDTWDRDEAEYTRSFVDGALRRESGLFDERLACGHVVEGHGDLRSKHVYLPDDERKELTIVDCIEFSDAFQFRYQDVGYDIAFLAMDLEARGYADLADELIGRYVAATADETLGLLQPLHRCLRALVRGKVDSLSAADTELDEAQRRAYAASAGQYFDLAAGYARRQAGPALLVLSGLSGTGKSILGGTLAARTGAAYVSSDAVRKALLGIEAQEHAGDDYRQGAYTPEMTERTYAELQRRAGAHLAAGRPVVMDATHSRAADRAAALDVAKQAGVPGILVELQLSREEALRRIAARREDPQATSDADEAIYERQTANFEPVEPPNDATHLVLDAALPVATQAREVARWLPVPRSEIP